MNIQHIVNEFLLTNVSEKLITFNNIVYPKFNNIVMLAGGAGSGKGFVLEKLVGMEGKVLDVDELKKLSLGIDSIQKLLKQEGFNKEDFDFKDPKFVLAIHNAVEKSGIGDKRQKVLIQSILSSNVNRRPNIILDRTFKNMQHLDDLGVLIKRLGYNKKNAHIVWVVNDINIAIKQNNERSRKVPADILKSTHVGASSTMAYLINEIGDNLSNYIDGDIWIVFNKVKVDSELVQSENGGSYIKTANYFKVKSAGKKLDKKLMTDQVLRKIKEYVPNSNVWMQN